MERFEIPILVIIRSRDELAAIIEAAPANHGSEELRSDAYFLQAPLAATATFAALPQLREGIDSVALGPSVIYFSRVAALAGKTRITRLLSRPMFQQMTVRNWRTTTTLLTLLDESVSDQL